jgi:mRNA interferase RelE/StbE
VKRTLILTHQAAKELDAMGATARAWMLEKLADLAMDPSRFANQIKRMQGSAALRIRFGGYRVIFTDSGVVLLILKAGTRGGIYKGAR